MRPRIKWHPITNLMCIRHDKACISRPNMEICGTTAVSCKHLVCFAVVFAICSLCVHAESEPVSCKAAPGAAHVSLACLARLAVSMGHDG